MRSSVTEVRAARAEKVRVTDEALIVDLVDGRTVSVPVEWYPRLAKGTSAERRRRIIGQGEGIHWPRLDEDIAVEDLLAGRRSGESQASRQQWMKSRGLRANKRIGSTRRKPQVQARLGGVRG